MTDRVLVDGYGSDMHIEEQRERVIEQLQAGFAGDRYEVEELERRLVLANTAESGAALDALVTDLDRTSTALVETKHVRVVLGSIERHGPWDLPQRMSARVVLGNLELDLRDARIAPGTNVIEVNVTLGNVEIVVPPGVSVEVGASTTLGNIEDRSEPVGPTRTIRIVGRVKLGNLEISTLQEGETHRDARWRRYYERRSRRRAMRHAHRRSLPPPHEW